MAGLMQRADGDGALYERDRRRPRLVQPTSREALDKIRPAAASIRSQVLEFIKQCEEYGSTDREIELALGIDGQTSRPRRRELVEKLNLVRDSGRTRINPSIDGRKGRRAIVWVYGSDPHWKAPESRPSLPNRDACLDLLYVTIRANYRGGVDAWAGKATPETLKHFGPLFAEILDELRQKEKLEK